MTAVDGDWCCRSTQAEVAELVGRRPDTVKEWVKAGMPRRRGSDGRTWVYDLREIVPWFVSREAARARVEGSKGTRDKTQLELEKLAVDLETSKLKLRKEAESLVDRRSAISEQARQYVILRNRLQAFPAEAASSMPTSLPTVEQALEAAAESEDAEQILHYVSAALEDLRRRGAMYRENVRAELERRIILLLNAMADLAVPPDDDGEDAGE